MSRTHHLVAAALAATLAAPSLGCMAASGSVGSEASNDKAASLGSSRTGYVVAEIDAANAGLDDATRAEKFAAMRESPSAFFRGTNHLYWKDLATAPQLDAYGGLEETRTWLGGDMHVDNTGAFDDDEGDVVFAINDFDEAVVADYQLDVWRMATSLVLLTRQNLGPDDEAEVLDAFSEAYLDSMSSDAGDDGETTRKFVASNAYGRGIL